MLQNIKKYMQKPDMYAPSTARFWDDNHISKGMLEAHLNLAIDSATRNLDFVQRSVGWISSIAPTGKYPRLLDLGCGPGIYAELFYVIGNCVDSSLSPRSAAKRMRKQFPRQIAENKYAHSAFCSDAGYQVTGVDLSKRSIEYAKRSAETKGKHITYKVCDYLLLDYQNRFDIATLIYCDFGVLSTNDRAALLKKIRDALRPNGCLIFDVFTPQQYAGQEEYKDWVYADSGFWSETPYLCLNSLYRYDEENTFLRQHLIITEDQINCYNVWEHTFKKDELISDLADAGFKIVGFYGDIAGGANSNDGKHLCVVAERIADNRL